jgi:hypothetical protein
MPDNVPRWGFGAAGASCPMFYWLNSGRDCGVQYAQDKRENPLGDLLSDHHEMFCDTTFGHDVGCQHPRLPLASSAAVLFPRTETAQMADPVIEADFLKRRWGWT